MMIPRKLHAFNQNIQQSHWLSNIIALFSGGLLTLAFAPFHAWYLALILPLFAYYSCANSSPKAAFCRGSLFGFGLFMTGASWIYVSLNTYGGAPPILAILACVILAFLTGLHLGVATYVQNKLWPNHSLIRLIFIFPILWVLSEWIRSFSPILFGGFPWLDVGYTQINTPLAGFASIMGVYGVSWLTILSGALLYSCLIVKKRYKIWPALIVIAIWSLGAWLKTISWTQPMSKSTQVSLIQGNISPRMKWSEQALNQTLMTYENLTAKALGSPIIIWPESAIPDYNINPQTQTFLKKLYQLAKPHHNAILVGLPIASPATEQVYNGAMVIGHGSGVYLKRHLVPFGEYIPMSQWFGSMLAFFDIPMSGFSPGPNHQTFITIQSLHVALFICYEIAFPTLVNDHVDHSNLIITQSDDGWFGNSLGPWQQQQMAQFRAIETGRPVLRATNNGITSVINRFGQIIASLPQNKVGILKAQVTPVTGLTPWDRYGLWLFGWTACLSLLLGHCLQVHDQKKNK